MSDRETGQIKGPRKWSTPARDLVKLRVRTLWVRGRHTHEIVRTLCKPDPRQIINPVTGNPYTPRTIQRIIVELREEARQANSKKINEHMGRVVEALWDLYRDAVIAKRKSEARRCLRDLSSALGGFVPPVEEGASETVYEVRVKTMRVNAGPGPEETESPDGSSEASGD